MVIILFAIWLTNCNKKYIDDTGIEAFDEDKVSDFELLKLDGLDVEEANNDLIPIYLSEYGRECKLVEGGNYSLEGKLDGTLIIDTHASDIHIYLNNASIVSQGGPAIIVRSAPKVVITSLEDTTNSISDNGDYRLYQDYTACIYSDSSLTINGKGEININGYYKNAIESKDVIKIIGGNLTLKSKQSAIHANDGIHIAGGNISISSEKQGLVTEKKGEGGKGNIMVSAGEMDIVAGEYAFVAQKASAYIYNCSIDAKSVLGTYDVANHIYVQEGCVNE